MEKNVQDARRRLWQPLPSFPDLASLNARLEKRCIEQWSQIQHGVLPGTADAWSDEVASLMPLGRLFDGFVEDAKRVSPTCLIHFERNRYSVPASFANRPVSLRVYPERLVIAAEGRIVSEHKRIIVRTHNVSGQTVYRLAPLPGGNPAQAWSAAQWCPVPRDAQGIPAVARPSAQSGRR